MAKEKVVKVEKESVREFKGERKSVNAVAGNSGEVR